MTVHVVDVFKHAAIRRAADWSRIRTIQELRDAGLPLDEAKAAVHLVYDATHVELQDLLGAFWVGLARRA